MKDSPYDDDPNLNPKLTEKVFIKSDYLFLLDITNKKFDQIVDPHTKTLEPYEPFFHNFNHFALAFNFFESKERAFYSSHEVMLKKEPTRMLIMNLYNDTTYTVDQPVIRTTVLFS